MSRLLPERAAMVVSSGQLAGVVSSGLGGRQDKSAQISFNKHLFPAESLAALYESLSLSKRTRLRIALASPWLRLALTPPVSDWLKDNEAKALARQAFVESYGESARSWEVRYQRQEQGEPFLACAIEPSTLDALHQAAGRHGIRHLHIEPLLALAWNRGKHRAKGLPWFALVEPEQLTLIHQPRGVWTSLASSAITGKVSETFSLLLERESARIGEPGNQGAGISLAPAFSSLQGWQWLGGQGQDALLSFARSTLK